MSRRQCAKCPWRKDVDPYTIPNGYDVEKHRALAGTINSGLASIGPELRIFACHESKPGREIHCVGWLANQLGPGNNLGLRIAAARDPSLTDFRLVGEQHECFEDTLPAPRRKEP